MFSVHNVIRLSCHQKVFLISYISMIGEAPLETQAI